MEERSDTRSRILFDCKGVGVPEGAVSGLLTNSSFSPWELANE